MNNPEMSRNLKCRQKLCNTMKHQAMQWNEKFGACEECYDEASRDPTRGIFTRWKKEIDEEKIALQETQAKGIMILICQRIKINKNKAYLRRFIFVKCVIISPFLNLLIDRSKFRLEFVRQNDLNIIIHLRFCFGFFKITVGLTMFAKNEISSCFFFASLRASYFFSPIESRNAKVVAFPAGWLMLSCMN